MTVIGAAVLTVAGRHQPLHQSAAAAEDAQRETPADRLAKRTQVRRYAQILLRTAPRHAEGAQHFVEDQQHAAVARQAEQRRHELFRRHDATGVVVNRFQDCRRQLVTVPCERLFQQLRPIVGQHNQVLIEAGGDAR